jgi:16S rRNA U516 pseudouridylate synthase RsuA-like enzyme
MVEAVGSEVVKLRRTRIGPLDLGELPYGTVRPLTRAELKALRRAAALSA